jgi:N utilization substance protein B
MRRQGRVCALQILYQLDLSGALDTGRPASAEVDEAIVRYWSSFSHASQLDQQFAERLVRGVAADLSGLDEAITGVSRNWKVTRMETVDRNVMRIAAYEILRCPDIPRAASINEAIEIAKRFSGQESAAFINGVLDQLRDLAEGDGASEP